jgi:hypothetical protein
MELQQIALQSHNAFLDGRLGSIVPRHCSDGQYHASTRRSGLADSAQSREHEARAPLTKGNELVRLIIISVLFMTEKLAMSTFCLGVSFRPEP